MRTSPDSMEAVRERFQRKAFSFDRLYDEDHPLQRFARSGLFARKELALETVRSYERPRVLDVGCGSARVGEAVLEEDVSEYVGVDPSEPMLRLAAERLARFGRKARLVEGDFLTVDLDDRFDVVLALGLFDYTPEPQLFVRRMFELCSGSVVGSFPRWNWLKGPIRKLRYEVIGNCPIFDYTEPGLRDMFGAAGFARVQVIPRGRTGFLVRAER